MRKQQLDQLLENAVARALGVTVPHKHSRRMVSARRTHQPIKHAA